MDTKRLYVDFHVLQTVPPSCVNRDDTGSPKTAVYGGAVRARVSSQAWKHAMRVMFTGEMSDAVETGYRTKKGTDLVAKQIKALAPDADAFKLTQEIFKMLKIKADEDGTKALFFLSDAQAKALAKLAVEGCKDKNRYKEALKEAPSADMALFGRMVADDPSLNYDAAAQVAHSISTHTVQNEFDYFTAVDDCAPEDNAGAGHLGTVEYNSATLYRYATVNVLELVRTLGAEQAAQTVRAFGEAFIRSMPTGKQNSFANRTLPDAVYVTLRRDDTEGLARLNGLRFAVRADQEGSLLVDFHTAKSRDTSYVTYRHYLQDAVFLAGLESEDEALLRELEAALRHPVYPLYLGRRSCPPTLPLCLGIRQGSLLDVLRTEPMQGRKPETGKLRIVADADPADPAAVPRQDLPVSFSPVHRQYGFRPVREWRLDRPEMPEPTEHDPMAELQN